MISEVFHDDGGMHICHQECLKENPWLSRSNLVKPLPRPESMQACMHIHPYMHTYMHTHMHTHTHTYTHTYSLGEVVWWCRSPPVATSQVLFIDTYVRCRYVSMSDHANEVLLKRARRYPTDDAHSMSSVLSDQAKERWLRLVRHYQIDDLVLAGRMSDHIPA